MRQRRTTVIVFLVLALVAAGAVVAIVSYKPAPPSETHTQSSSHMGSSGISLSSSQTSYPDGQAYLNVSPLYSAAGYPTVTYSSYSPYLPSKPNYTMEYQTVSADFQVGSVGGDVISLDQAVGIAAEKADLNPTNYSLAEADFEPGVIVNSTLSIHPEWILFFAQVDDGYWLWGDVGNSAVSVQVTVDALNGAALLTSGNSGSNGATPPSGSTPALPAPTAQFKLNVNSSEALDAVRNGNLSGVPEALSAAGSVTFVSPRVVLFGPSSDNEAFMNPVNSSFDGRYDLCWVIDLFSSTPGAGYQGTFAVDTDTGELVSGWAQVLFPGMEQESVMGTINGSSATNLIVSPEVFQIDGSIVGSSGSVPVTVPNVVVVAPGSTASIGLNFSSTMTENISATMSLVNPLPGIETLPNGLPDGVSLQFSPQALVVPGNGSASTRLVISIDKNAPSGTYLVEVDAMLYDSHGVLEGGSEVLFFLSVWDGSGSWPPPPTIN